MGYFEMRRDSFSAEGEDSWWGDGCIAAYQFKGATSEADSLIDLTGHGYNLSEVNNPVWDTSKGFFLVSNKYLNCTTLNALDTINTIIIRYSALPSTDGFIGFSQIKGSSGGYEQIKNMGLMARVKFYYQQNGTDKYLNKPGPGILCSYIPDSYSSAEGHGNLIYRYASRKLNSSGVLASTRTKLYADGEPMVTSIQQVITGVTQLYSSDSPNTANSYTLSGDTHGGHYVLAAAFYTDALSADDIRERSLAMAGI